MSADTIDPILQILREETPDEVSGLAFAKNPFAKDTLFKGKALDPENGNMFYFFSKNSKTPFSRVQPIAVRITRSGVVAYGKTPVYNVDLYLDIDDGRAASAYADFINSADEQKIFFIQTGTSSEGKMIGLTVGNMFCSLVTKGTLAESLDPRRRYVKLRCNTVVKLNEDQLDAQSSLPAYVRPRREVQSAVKRIKEYFHE